VLDDVLHLLRCPTCSSPLGRVDGTVRCAQGHSFDVARQGYLSLLGGDARLGSADTAPMVAAREAFLQAGHFKSLAEAVAGECERVLTADGCVVDLGAGTGWYATRVLERLADRVALALDLSRHALQRAARAHPRLSAVRADAWRGLPLRDQVAALALSVFSPRNAAELARVLRPDGTLVVVAPMAAHLAELVAPLGLLGVDERKHERLSEQFEPHFVLLRRRELTWPLRLARADARNAAAMGPSAFHLTPAELEARVAALPDPVTATAAVTLATYRPR
jgi:23S rRNA (guanine745-N1)-methyltransferase